MHPVSKKKAAGQRGIALVVVLALLAMLVIMSVSFVVFMRTERTASRDYAEFVKARNLAQAGLTRALVRMQQDMNLTNQFYHGGWAYSYGGAEKCTDWLNNGYDLKYVPQTLVASVNLARTTSGPVTWNNLVTTKIGGTTSNMLGRYAFIVLDCSDFVDINAITNRVRGAGTDPGEVTLPSGAPATLLSQRTSEHPFQTVCEMGLRNAGTVPSHLVTYSYVPVDSYFTNNSVGSTVQGRLYISTNVATIKSMVSQIQTLTAKAGFDPAFADLLVDFADTSTDVRYNDPSFQRMGGGKLVPMMYQIAATNGLRQVTVAGKKRWEVETRIFYETWFPFPVTANKTYSLKLPAVPKASVPTPAVAGFPWSATPVTNGWQSSISPFAISATPPTIQTALPFTNSFWTNTYVIVYTNGYTGTLTSATTTLTLPTSASVMNGTGGGGTAVDQANLPAMFTTAFVAPANKSVNAQGYGVVDPRINYRVADWRKSTATTLATLLGKTNEFCDVKGSKYDKDTDSNGDGSTFMYARRPGAGMDPAGLYSIGDLGYLLYHPDKPWHTVRLTTPQNALKDNSAYVFNLLSILPTNHIYQGFVNPNSQDAGALMSAFQCASRARYYNEAGAPAPVTTAQATTLAQDLINKGIKLGKNNAYTNIADVCRLTGGYSGSDLQNATGDTDLWRQKAIMGSSIGLMNPRQNYWLVLVCAQSVRQITQTLGASPVNGTDYFVTAEAQCLAFIWRDPYEDVTDTVHTQPGTKRHKMFVQFFKWL